MNSYATVVVKDSFPYIFHLVTQKKNYFIVGFVQYVTVKNELVILPFNTILQRKVFEENNGMDEIKKSYMPKFQRENKDSLLSRVGSNHEH